MRHTRSKSASERRERQWEQQESVVSERERHRLLCLTPSLLRLVVRRRLSCLSLSSVSPERTTPPAGSQNFGSQNHIPISDPRNQVPICRSQTQIPISALNFRSQNSSPQGVCRSHFQIPKKLKSPKCKATLSDPKTTQVPKVQGHTFRSQNSGPQSVGHKLRSQNIGLELRSQKICLNFRSQISGANFISYFLFRYKMHPTQKPPPKLRSQIQIPRFRLCFSGKPTWIPKFRSQSQFMCLGAIHSGPQIQVPISNQNIYQVSKFRSQNAGANFRSCLSTST